MEGKPPIEATVSLITNVQKEILKTSSSTFQRAQDCEGVVDHIVVSPDVQQYSDNEDKESECTDEVYIKKEEDYDDGELTILPEDEVSALPLDVQIAEGEDDSRGLDELPLHQRGDVEEEDSDCLEGLPVKTEFVESGDEDLVSKTITVEPLEESYEDRINDFIRAVTNEKLKYEQDRVDNNNESEDEASETHFLSRTRSKRAKRSLTCENCSATFRYQSTYDYHVKSQCGTKMIAGANRLVKKGKNQSFTCNVCQKQMCSRTSLMVHMRIHNGERPFVCVVCTRSFIQKAHLKDHMKIHAEGKQAKPIVFPCSECGEVFDEKKFLQSHMQMHFGDKIFDCKVCHKRFRTRSNLSNHKMIHSDKRDHSCTICGKGFLRKPNLTDHMKVHTKEKPFSCEICGKLFAEKSRRNIHVKRHTGELTQVCAICDKKFACSYDLRVHQRMHTGEKPFSCNICGRMFNRKAIMETHMTIHTGRKDFICTQCGEAFNRKSKLDVHLTNHSGEKFHCEICHRVFKCKAYLVPHIRTHFGQGRRRRGSGPHCLICRRQFSSSQLLQSHLVQDHPTLFSACPETTFIKVESHE